MKCGPWLKASGQSLHTSCRQGNRRLTAATTQECAFWVGLHRRACAGDGCAERPRGKVDAVSPYFPHRRDSQLMSRLATTITIPVMSTAKQEKSRRSLKRKRMLTPPPLPPLRMAILTLQGTALRSMPDSGTITKYFALAFPLP